MDAEPGEDRGELHADIACSNDHDALGQALELKAFVGSDEVLRTRELGNHRVAAGGDQNCPRADWRFTVGELHRVFVFEHGAGEHELDARLLERASIDAVQPVDLAMNVADQRRPIEAQIATAPAEIARVGKGVGIPAAVDEQLLRHAAADHAGAADAIFLGDGHLGAKLCRESPGTHAARTCPDHEQIAVVATHLSVSVARVARRRAWPRSPNRPRQETDRARPRQARASAQRPALQARICCRRRNRECSCLDR